MCPRLCGIVSLLCVELYRKISSLLSDFPLDSVMLRFSDVTNTLESLAKYTRWSLTKVPRMSDRRSGTLERLRSLFHVFSAVMPLSLVGCHECL